MLRGMMGVLTGMKSKIKLEEGSPCDGDLGSEPTHEVVTLLGISIVDVTPSEGELGMLLPSILCSVRVLMYMLH